MTTANAGIGGTASITAGGGYDFVLAGTGINNTVQGGSGIDILAGAMVRQP